MSAYYLENHLRPNPGKTQICSFHLKNREAKRELNVTFGRNKARTSPAPSLPGSNPRPYPQLQGAHPEDESKGVHQEQPTASTHQLKVGSSPKYAAYNSTSPVFFHRRICLPSMVQIEPRTKNRPYPQRDLQDSDWVYKNNPPYPAFTPSLASLPLTSAEQPPPKPSAQSRPMTTGTHSINTLPPQKRLRSRSSFLDATAELETTPPAARIAEWHNQWNSLGSQTTRWTERGITPDECLATGHDQPWAVWKTLNRLRVGEGRCKASMKKWTLTSSDACVCGEPQTMEHIMSCTYAPQCTGDDLAEPNAAALTCANHWKDVI